MRRGFREGAVRGGAKPDLSGSTKLADLYRRDPQVLAGWTRPFEFRCAERDAARSRFEEMQP